MTGASRGIGLAIAIALAEAGAARVTLVARGEEELAAATARVRERSPGTELASVPCDVASAAEVEALFARAGAHEIVVASAGTNARSRSPTSRRRCSIGCWRST